MELWQKTKEKLRTLSTKIKKRLVEYKIVTEISLKLPGSQFMSFVTEIAPKAETSKKK